MSETTTGTTETTTTTTAPWHAGIADQETLGYWQNRGWDQKTPAEVAVLASKAAHEAQKFVGAPPEALLRMPKDAADEAGWKAVWKRLGAPDDATGYDFSAVKRADGSAPDAALTEALRATAAKLNMPKDTVSALAGDLVKHLDAQAAEASASRDAALIAAKADLARNWGANFEANKFVAAQAAQKLGVTGEQLTALEGVVGYDKVMEMFRNLGTKMGEDKFVASSAGGSGSGVMSVAQAHDQKRSLMADTEWSKRYLNGGQAEIREMTALNTLISASQG